MTNWRYRLSVSPEAQTLAEQGMYKANVFVEGADAPPAYSDSVRDVLDRIADALSLTPSPETGSPDIDQEEPVTPPSP